MAATAEPKSPAQSGLEAVERNDAPEVYAANDNPTPQWSGSEKTDHPASPASTHLPTYEKASYAPLAASQSVETTPSTTMHESTPNGHGQYESDVKHEPDTVGPRKKWTKRKHCGITGLWLVVLLTILVLLLVAGILCGVLLTQLPKKQERRISVRAIVGGGFAAITPAGDPNTMFTYHQTEDNLLIESRYANGVWSYGQDSNEPTIMAEAMRPQSPISAVSYRIPGSASSYRRVFFVGNDSSIHTAVARDNEAWTPPTAIVVNSTVSGTQYVKDPEVASNSPALAACVLTGLYRGISLFYGDSGNYIQHVFLDATANDWAAGEQLVGDAGTGVGCSHYADSDYQILNVWYRDVLGGYLSNIYRLEVDNGQAVSLMWQYAESEDYNVDIGSGTTVSVTNDGDGNDYVFYQDSASAAARAQVAVDDSDFTDSASLTSIARNSKLASVWYKGETVFLYQRTDSGPEIHLATVGTNGGFRELSTIPETGGE